MDQHSKVEACVIKEIERLRTEVCPNMGKMKVRIFLDEFCEQRGYQKISASTIGRVIKRYKIFHHHRKIYHNGKIKEYRKVKKKRKPKRKGFQAAGRLIEIDTVVKYILGIKRYVITAVDTYTRYSFAYSYRRLNSTNAKDFAEKMLTAFPYEVKAIQTDNGLEFHKHFRDYLVKKKITHYWTYPRRPQSNGHIEKYNRTIQEEYLNYHLMEMEETEDFNVKLMDWLIWYNTRRPHWSLGLKAPMQFIINK